MEPSELSPETLRMLEAVLATAPTPPRPAVTRRQVAEYVLGGVSDEERARVVSALTRQPELRNAMVEMRRDLSRLVVRDADLKAVLSARASGTIEGARAMGPRSDWLSQAREGSETLQALFGDLGKRLGDPRLGGFATARGPEAIPIAGAAMTAQLVAKVEDGDLRLEAELSEIGPPGMVIHARIEDPELGAIEIGSAPTSALHWELVVPAAGSTLGLPSGEMSTHAVRLSVSPGADMEPLSWRVEFEDEPNRMPLWLAGSGQPSIAGRILRVPVALRSEMASTLDGYLLCLYVRVRPRRLPLVITPVGELAAKGFFECEIDAPDGPVPPEAFLISLRRESVRS